MPVFWLKLLADVPAVKASAGFLGALMAYFLPTDSLKRAAIAALGLVFLDTVSGVIAAKKTGQSISSAGFSQVIVKGFAYSAFVVVAGFACQGIPGCESLQSFLCGGALGCIVATESISVLENLRKLGFKDPFGLGRFIGARNEAYIDKP